MLADGFDPLAVLYQQWPWMVLIVGAAKWISAKLDAGLARHIAFVDATDRREEIRVATDRQLAVALASISDELKDHGQKLSDIKKSIPSSSSTPPGSSGNWQQTPPQPACA